MSLEIIRNEISAVQQELLLKLEIKSIAMLELSLIHISQESEISENILLPDLAKQPENIEQPSGGIAERGMPT